MEVYKLEESEEEDVVWDLQKKHDRNSEDSSRSKSCQEF